MKKNKTKTSVLCNSLLSVCTKLAFYSFLVFFTTNPLLAQCDLTCNDNVQVTLDDDCFKEITADMILEGTYDASCEPFTVVVEVTGSNFVTGDQIGETVNVSVTAANNNTCWGTITVVDENAPVIECQTFTITCLDDPDDVADPDVSDNCDDPVDLSFVENIDENGCNGQYYRVITRTYTAVDNSGNTSTCDQIINVTRPSLSQVDFPLNYDDLQLDALDCDNPNTNPSNTGEPTIDGYSIDNVCDFAISYVDQEFDICQNSYKILREWTVNDWCTSQNISQTQIIKVLDKTAPNLTCPADIELSTENDDCFGSVIVPSPNVSDDCSSSNNIVVEFSASAGDVSGNLLYNLPIGNHTLTYTATDDCGNSTTCTVGISVEDDVPPIVACETNHVVSLSSSTPSLVGAQSFDDGSYDLCGNVTFLARRMDTPHCPGDDGSDFSAFVPFYCCDVGNTVMVELQVTDESGNINSCMVETTVEDAINPTISCPPNVSLDCSEDPDDLSLTGEATATDNCNATVSYFDNQNQDNCGGGQINRIWTATDDSGNTASCVQIISLVNSTPFFITDVDCNNSNPNDGVIWPCDYDTNSCGPGLDPSTTGEPEIFEDQCDLVAVTYEDLYLPITPPACLKVLRTWIIVDWCQYDEDTGAGYWEYTQVIKVLNSEDPNIITNCNDKAFCSYDEDCLEGSADLLLEANDDCTDSLDLNYKYWIDLDNDGSDDIAGETNDASGIYPLGTHKIRWHVEDGCGNVSTCEYLFIISDCKAPTPNILNGIAVDLMENCEIEIWATDFDNPSSPSYDNCGIDHWLIQSPSQGPGQPSPPVTAEPSWIFDDQNIGTNTVDIWILDINGNWAYASTYIIIQDNVPPFCLTIEYGLIYGTIETEDTLPVNNVIIGINTPGLPEPANDTITTDINGYYKLTNLDIGGNYVVSPLKDVDPLNGVTTYDLVLISQHILQIDTLDSPYKIIAADANNSGSVSTLDLVELRKLILFIETEFPNNTSWRFVDAEFVFPNPQNPWETSFPELFSINGLPEEPVEANFTAMKIGDVNGSANTSEFTSLDSRSGEKTFFFEIENQSIEAGKYYEIQFNSKDLQTILAYQFTLQFDPDALDFQNIETAVLPDLNNENFGLSYLDKGFITTSWNHILPVALESNEQVFTLSFKALKDAQLSEILRITSDFTKAEAYDQTGNPMNIELGFTKSDESLVLYQNTPNPFNGRTKISFNLPTEGEAVISIFDVSGRLVKIIEKEFFKGYNEIEINDNELNATGILYYQLKTADGSITRKMVHTGSKN
jgi:HYR domain/Secretion system C-terminal sorting domain/Cohesin domain